jgi:hypothetical protein
MAKNKKSISDLHKEKSERIMDGVGYWAAFYRKNPQRFVKEFLNIKLKLFQKILIYMMMVSTNFLYIASRGSGKTWLTSLYCVVRCILYPGTKICVASGVKSQAVEVITKIETDFLKNYSWGSQNLRNEISFISSSVNNARVDFHNGSWINIVTSNDNARHNRANIIVVDEFRMVDLNVINTVLRKFLTTTRMPGYLSNPEYAHLQERNSEMYMSSAFYQSHWAFDKVKAYFANMLDDKRKYFCCGLPYQLAIKEGLLQKEQVEDEMSEDDFDEIAFSMEMGALFYGDSDGAFFRYDDISKHRKIKNAYYSLDMYEKRGINVPELAYGEKRIMSVDVALMATKKHANDATAITINVAIPNNNNSYMSNIVYIETFEGLKTDELGIIVMRYFYNYKCTDLVLDCQGNGLGVYDFITKEQYDTSTGATYESMCSCNDDNMASRCTNKNANKVVWTIKASAEFNSVAATSLRAGIKNGNINFLVSEFDIEDHIKKTSGYSKMSVAEQTRLKLPYVQTSFLINEMINLEHEIVNNKVKLRERSGMRKDRFSSLEYNYYIAQQLALRIKPKQDLGNLVKQLTIRPAKQLSTFE